MLAAAAAAFVAIFVAEFGDKTQLVSMSMACRYHPMKVLAGAMVALAAVIGLAVWAGGYLSAHIPHRLVAILSGAVFMVIGLFTYFKKEETSVGEKCENGGFLQTLFMVFLAEFGDKTQLAAFFLAASLGYPLAVFSGAMAAMLLNHLFAVYLGSRFLSKLKPQYLKVGTAALFFVIGAAIIIGEIVPLS